MSELIKGDSLIELAKLKDNSVDLIVTDPPYGYSFMGKEWDKALPDKRIWKECLRVLKHGGFAYVMSAPRQDVLSRMMIDLEGAGFNTSFTSMYWAYASGFPKAMNISKAVDKKLGVEREVVGKYGDGSNRKSSPYDTKAGWNENDLTPSGNLPLTKPTSPQAKKLDGSYAGFQPKPAVEVIIVCMKPLSEKGYIGQAMKNGKGVSWFGDCRIPYIDEKDLGSATFGNNSGLLNKDKNDYGDFSMYKYKEKIKANPQGRFPANLIVSDNAVDTGNITGDNRIHLRKGKYKSSNFATPHADISREDSGDFSRYFDIDKWYESQFIITPKASKSEKDKGLDGFDAKTTGQDAKNRVWSDKCKTCGLKFIGGDPRCHCPTELKITDKEGGYKYKNNHPTVKPLKLMSYLITLGSRKGDIVLDPFMGSGTTPLASKNLNREYIGIEINDEYFEICCARVENNQGLDEFTQ